MKRYLINTTIFILAFFILVFALAYLSSQVIYNKGFENWEAESNLLMMKSDHDYGLLIMGISHARNFSRHKNHLRIEKILDREIINIGIGGGQCGANDQLFFLKYFYNRGNKANQVLYVLSPTLMTKGFSNKASNTFKLEPFRFDFFVQYLDFKTDNKYERLFYYIKSKFSRKWMRLKPSSLESKKAALEDLDSTKIKEGLKLLLVDGERVDEFQRNSITVEETIKLAKANNSEVIFIIPPALFGKWFGHFAVMDFLKAMNEKYGTAYYDFSESVLIPEYYYDHHHLNSVGIDYFTENFLKKVLIE
jgi:hypothetical protein